MIGTKTQQQLYSLPAINTQQAGRILLFISLVLVDLGMFIFSFRLAYAMRFEMTALKFLWLYQEEQSTEFYVSLILILVPLWMLVFWLFGLYDLKNLFSGTREYALVLNACTMGTMVIIFVTFFVPTFVIARGWLVLSWVMLVVSTEIGRFTIRHIVQAMRANGHFSTSILIIGANEEGQAIASQLQSDRKTGIRIVGFVDDHLSPGTELLPDMFVLGPVASAESLVNHGGIDEIIIPATALPREKLLNLLQTFVAYDNLAIRLTSGLYEWLTTGVEVYQVGGVPLLSINKVRLTGADVFLKRILDLGLSMCIMPIFIPFAMLIAIAIKFDSPGPVIYRRRVTGVGGKLFDAFKFRTMYVDGDKRLAQFPELKREFEQNFKLKNDPRITRMGRLLRSTSLDELPQIINVMLGQMSLVGPRMITYDEQVKYGKWRWNLVTVKPGITGLWQVSGRSDIDYGQRVVLDMHYIRNYSIWFDLYILWRTVPAVLAKKGAY